MYQCNPAQSKVNLQPSRKYVIHMIVKLTNFVTLLKPGTYDSINRQLIQHHPNTALYFKTNFKTSF